MKISKQSSITGKVTTRDIPVNPEDYIFWMAGNVSIEDAMPYLSETDKEFILAGISKEEWSSFISKELENIE